MDLKLIPYADKIDGAAGATGTVSADDMNQLKKILNAIVTALFTLDNNGIATSAVIKAAGLPNIDLIPLFSSDFVLSNNVIALANAGTGGGTITPQLATPASLTAASIAATGMTLNWSAVTNATGYILQRSTAANFAGATSIYTGAALTFADTGLTASTTYYYRVLATGSGYSNSANRTNSFATIAAAGGGTGLTQLTAFDFYDTLAPIAGTPGSFKWDNTAGSSDTGFAVKSSLKIPAGGIGILQVQCMHNVVGSSSGWIGLYQDVVNYTGQSDSELAMRRNNSGSIGYRYTGQGEQGTANGALVDNGYLRLRTDGTTIYLEKSTDATTWSLVFSRAQVNHDLFIHCQILGGPAYSSDQDKVSNIMYSGFVAA